MPLWPTNRAAGSQFARSAGASQGLADPSAAATGRSTIVPNVHRVVIGANQEEKSAVIYRDSPNHLEEADIFWRSTLWATTELPVDNTVPGDRSADVTVREPSGNGLFFRALEIPPDIKDTGEHIKKLREVNKEVKQKYPPTEADLARHPSMHRTDTLDMFTVAYGEIHLVTDTDETRLQPGDTAVVQGVNHAWANKSDKPCMIIGVMVHADPWPADKYPAAGL
jgi:mannose-6-phosphate isomerase-like protein (cupin superfamily)